MVLRQSLAKTELSFEIVGNGRRGVFAYSERRPRMILMNM